LTTLERMERERQRKKAKKGLIMGKYYYDR
jgi:hypothetical protein